MPLTRIVQRRQAQADRLSSEAATPQSELASPTVARCSHVPWFRPALSAVPDSSGSCRCGGFGVLASCSCGLWSCYLCCRFGPCCLCSSPGWLLAWTWRDAARSVALEPRRPTIPTDRALARAEEAVTSDEGRAVPGWAQWMDHTQAEIVAGRCWTELHRPLRAVPVLESALAAYDDFHARDKSLYLTWLADSYIDATEIEQAVSVMNRVLDLSAGIGSVRPRQRAVTVIRRLAPRRDLPLVADLMDRAAS